MRDNKYTILNTPEYDRWLAEQTDRGRVQVKGRIARIRESGYFGDFKNVEDDV